MTTKMVPRKTRGTELGFVLRERAVASPDTRPAGVHVYVEPNDGCLLLQELTNTKTCDGTAAEVERAYARRTQQVFHHLRLMPAKDLLAFGEQLRNRLAGCVFDRAVHAHVRHA